MAEPTSSLAAAIVAVVVKLVPGALGSLISLWFVGGGLTRKQKAMSFASGAVLAYFAGPLIVTQFAIADVGSQQAVGFFVGLFGLAIAKELFKMISSGELLGALKRRVFGE